MTKQVIMPSISCVVARTRCDSEDRKYRDSVIGCGNKLPWHLKSDLRRFREITTGHAIIMGSNTFESIGRPLANRTNIILSREAKTKNSYISSDEQTQSFWAASREEALYIADVLSILREKNEFFIAGGVAIFKLFSDLVDKVYLTEVFADLPGDAFFESKFPLKTWKLRQELDFSANDGDQYASRFCVYERRERRYRYRFLPHLLSDQVTKNDWVAERIAKKRSKIEDYALAHQAELDLG